MGKIIILNEGTEMQKWECTVCGYMYDPEVGDEEHGVKPGTPFEGLPEDWACPVCGATKDQFVKKE
jgi:rubredoxin